MTKPLATLLDLIEEQVLNADTANLIRPEPSTRSERAATIAWHLWHPIAYPIPTINTHDAIRNYHFAEIAKLRAEARS